MEVFWSIVLRSGQTAIEASSTLFVGFFVAAVMRKMIGSAGTRRLFGGTGIKGLFRAWVIGSLLPVCSVGVIPVARELRRAGVPTGTILAFILAAPQLNPLSFLYGLTLSEPIVIICFVIGTMLLAIVGGELWKRFFASTEDEQPVQDEELPAPGVKRLGAVLLSAARDVISPSTLYALIGILTTGLIAGSLGFGSLSHSMRHDDLASPALMMLIGLPAYSGVLPGMMRIGLIFEHGNSTGAAFVLFEVGVGLNLGLILWLLLTFGKRFSFPGVEPVPLEWQHWRRTLSLLMWLGLMLLLVLGVAYGMEYPLYFAQEEATHTHAFDDWTSPFPSGSNPTWEEVRQKTLQKIEVLEPVALGGLLTLGILGLLATLFDRPGRVDRWLTAAPPVRTVPQSIWNRSVPGPVLGILALLGLVLFSVVALYIYYPNVHDGFEEIVRVRADALTAVRSGHKEEAIRQIERWDLLSRKVQVGVFLRTGRLLDNQAQATQALRDLLEKLRDALLANDLPAAKEMIIKVEEAHRACRATYESP